MRVLRVLLLSTYDLGRQPFALASPAAWLREEGHEVRCADLAVEALPHAAVREAELVALYLPMHTATRLAGGVIQKVKAFNPQAHVCCYGLYAPLNDSYLRSLGVESVIGGEFEPALVALARRLQHGGVNGEESGPQILLERLQFRTPDRSGLPGLNRYAKLHLGGERRRTGYTEASRGCKHLCRHCPVVPVYNGQFRVVQQGVVLADIRQQVAAGAQHITFGDPDFFNGPAHAIRVVEALHSESPDLSYDVTIKVEHLLRHCDLLPALRRTGCAFVTSAVESTEDDVLRKLDKGHTRDDFIDVTRALRGAGLAFSPTLVPFTPWTTWSGYRDLLDLLLELDLVENVSPIHLALRLLIPSGSRVLELPDIGRYVAGFDRAALIHRWKHPDEGLDKLSYDLMRLVTEETRRIRS